jgi:hypothetical protein
LDIPSFGVWGINYIIPGEGKRRREKKEEKGGTKIKQA